MKKIITALASPEVNTELKKYKNIEIIGNDIQYQEGVIETLEKNSQIDYIILSAILDGKYEIYTFVKKIKMINPKIKIILILEKENSENTEKLILSGASYIFYNNAEIKDILKIINNNKENENEELKEELKKIKKLLLENNKKDNKITLKNNKNLLKNKQKIFIKFNKKIKILKNKLFINMEKNKRNSEIISVLGTAGVGKSVFTVNLANSYIFSKNKILIIDFDILNNSLHTILGIKKYSKKIREKLKNNNLINNKINIEELIIKVTNKIDLISGINLIFDSKYKISSEKISDILKELKNKYDVIIIDTSSECFFDYTKNIIENSNINIFIAEANLSELKKSRNLLDLYINKWKIDKKKINILFNKYNKNSIYMEILKNIFHDFNILGKLDFNDNYNLIINKNGKNINKKIAKEYLNINNKLNKI